VAQTIVGSTLIIGSNRNGNWYIFKQRVDTDFAAPLVAAPGNQLLPELSSDGRWLPYVELVEDERGGYERCRSDARGVRPAMVSTRVEQNFSSADPGAGLKSCATDVSA